MKHKIDLNSMVNSISTREDLVSFVRTLSNDFNQNPLEWENKNLGQYLEAMSAWIQDMDGYFKNTNQPMPTIIDWRVIGQILLAAKIYE